MKSSLFILLDNNINNKILIIVRSFFLYYAGTGIISPPRDSSRSTCCDATAHGPAGEAHVSS